MKKYPQMQAKTIRIITNKAIEAGIARALTDCTLTDFSSELG